MNDAAHRYLARVERLSDVQRTALADRLGAATPGLQPAQTGRSDTARLVAWIVPAGDTLPDAAGLRQFAAARLPDYMVPQHVVVATSLPRTPGGKLDRKALQVPAAAPVADDNAGGIVLPRNDAETRLAAIWCEVLGLDEVSIDDNFFEVGGDSLLSIRILSRAGKAGLKISPEHFFAEPTVAAQAAAAQRDAAAMSSSGPVCGPTPLMPIQRWFFRRIAGDAHHWNQSALYAINDTLDAQQLKQALNALTAHHDALRIRISGSTDNPAQRIAPPGDEAPLEIVGMSADPGDAAAIEAVAQRLNASLRFDDGWLLRFTLFRGGRRDRLLIVAHHLVVDAVSWRVLIEDLETLCAQIAAGQPASLPHSGVSFQSWAMRLDDYARSDEISADLDYWRQPIAVDATTLPRDSGDDTANTVASAQLVTVALPADLTAALLAEVPQAYRTRIDEILLTALGLALAGWTGRKQIVVDTEGHGRDAVFDGVDVSRTVGWLTTVFPVRLDIDTDQPPDATVRAVKEQLRAIPRRGLSHGLLRDLGDAQAVAALAAQPEARVLFNYLGQVDRLAETGAMFERVADNPGTPRSPAGLRAYWLEINALVTGGALQAQFSYSTALHRQETIAALADAYIASLQTLIDTLTRSDIGGFTPADFPLADLNQHDLDAIAGLLDDD